tara:strand:- start:1144 stop:1512 length:369 start_codon:yes stop_codon:yes gene_type:complete
LEVQESCGEFHATVQLWFSLILHRFEILVSAIDQLKKKSQAAPGGDARTNQGFLLAWQPFAQDLAIVVKAGWRVAPELLGWIGSFQYSLSAVWYCLGFQNIGRVERSFQVALLSAELKSLAL